MRASKGLFKGLNPTMAMTALTVITLFLLFGVFVPETAASWFVGAKDQIIAGFKWYYILVVALFLFFAVYLMFSRFGNIRLGDDDQVPEFGYFAWFSMLFSAGMGIGLVFWSIAEPMNHLQGNPFITEGMTPEAAQIAMRLTFFHWGLHPWAIYVIVGLSLAFFSYRRKLPLAIRSVLYPLLGDRIYGCDECQEVCPPARRSPQAKETIDASSSWVDLLWMLQAEDDELLSQLGRWYIPRRDPRYLRRNALLALGNSADPESIEVRAEVERFAAPGADDEMLQEHAQWALRRLNERAQVRT